MPDCSLAVFLKVSQERVVEFLAESVAGAAYPTPLSSLYLFQTSSLRHSLFNLAQRCPETSKQKTHGGQDKQASTPAGLVSRLWPTEGSVYPFAYMFQAKVPKFPFIAKKDANASMQAHKVLSDRGSGASMNVRLTPESGHSSA
jgi:hypothetical protein